MTTVPPNTKKSTESKKFRLVYNGIAYVRITNPNTGIEKTYRCLAADVPLKNLKKIKLFVTGEWDIFTGKKGKPSDCAVSNSANRQKKLFSFIIFGASTTLVLFYAITRVDEEGNPTHVVRYRHNFDVRTFDIGGGKIPQTVTLTPITGRNRYGQRKDKPKKGKGKPKSTPSKKPYQYHPRGGKARTILQRMWMDDFIGEHGADGVASRTQQPSA